MSRKDYVKFAEMLRTIPLEGPALCFWKDVRDRIADIFAADNPNFDRERFEKACQDDYAAWRLTHERKRGV